MLRFTTRERRSIVVAGVLAMLVALPAGTSAASPRIGWMLQPGANDGTRTKVAVYGFSNDGCVSIGSACEIQLTVTLPGLHTLPNGNAATALILLDSGGGTSYVRVRLSGIELKSFATTTQAGVTRTTSTGLIREVTSVSCTITVADAGQACALPADHFGVQVANPVVRTPTTATLTARDVYGQKVTGYRGTVRISDTKAATLPKTATFTAADAGVHVVSGVVFNRAGKQVLRFRDTTTHWPTTGVRITVGR
jgi:hypothetical protein